MAKQTRLSWAIIAEQVLADSTEPLHSYEIVEIATQRGLRQSSAKSPDHSLQAAIWRNIRKLGSRSPFVMIGSGRVGRKYGLRLRAKNEAGKGTS